MSNYFFEVLRPGINTTFQDKGRFHMQHFGVTPGGCMDQDLFSIANALVGNSLEEGVLEFAYQGPLLKLIKGKTKIAITGNVFFQIIKSNQETIIGECNRTYVLVEGAQVDIELVPIHLGQNLDLEKWSLNKVIMLVKKIKNVEINIL